MRRLFLGAALAVWATAALVCCQSADQKAEDCPPGQTAMQVQAADRDFSELALLMRRMWYDMDTIRRRLKAGEPISDVRPAFARLHRAVPTDPEVKDDYYQAMGDGLLRTMDELYAAQTPEARLAAYTVVIDGCLACHRVHCPGPTDRIKKLKL